MRSFRWNSSPRCSSRVVGLVLASSSLLIATGCGVGTPATPSPSDLSLLSGSVYGGQQAVTGATVNLYATTATGTGAAAYGGTPTLLGTTTTTSAGYFTFGAVTACTASQQAYLVATGGNPGLTGSINNTALVLMAALGTCGGSNGITSATAINVNELTTVAAAYALSGFLPAGGAGITNAALLANTAKGVTTSSTNNQGLADGMADANQMVNFANGNVYTTTPNGGTLTSGALVSLGNALASCVNTNGSTASGSNCNALFAAATPPAGSVIAAPVNTLQAILDIAAYPGNNVQLIYNTIPGTGAAFGTGGLTAQPNDWTLGITYTNASLVSPTGLTIDATDNVYTVGYPTSSTIALLEFSPQGALLSPVAGWNSTSATGSMFKYADNPRQIKFDPSGNLFLADAAVTQIIEYTPAGTPTSPTAGTFALLSYASVSGTANNWGIGIDTSGNVFSENYKSKTCAGAFTPTNTVGCGLIEFPAGNFGAPTATIGGAQLQIATAGSRDVAIDSINHFAYTGQNQLNLVYVSNLAAGTQATTTLPTCALPYGIAVDGNSFAWVAGLGNPTGGTSNCTTATVSPSQLYQINTGATLVNTIGSATTTPSTIGTTGTPFNGAFYDVVDGNGNIFVANSTSNAIAEYSPAFTYTGGATPVTGVLLSPNVGFAPGTTYSGTAVSGGTILANKSIAIDRSGATWTLSSGTAGNLVQVFGASAPTNPVLAAGGYGVKP